MNDQALPFVSVIMPVRNEAKYIERSLGAVLAQDYPADRMEVIIADGMSDDGTREIIQKNFTLQVPSSNGSAPTLKLIDNPGKIVSTGLNRAIEISRGEIIVRVDGHCEVDRDYVRNCVLHIQSSNVDGVGGAIETIGLTPVARAIALAMSSRFGVGDSAFRTLAERTKLVDTIPFPAYTRAIIEKVGPYDEEQIRNQDDEYNYRLRKNGAKLLLAADVRSRYYSRASFRSLAKQYFQYGYWKVRVMQKHPRQMRLRQFVPGVFLLSVFASVCLAMFSPSGAWLLLSLASTYALTNVIAALHTSRKTGLRLLPLVSLAFMVLHVAYGSGFLVGMVRFMTAWGRGSVSPAWSATDRMSALNV